MGTILRAIGIPLNDIQGAISILKDGNDYSVGAIRVEGLKPRNIQGLPLHSIILSRENPPVMRTG